MNKTSALLAATCLSALAGVAQAQTVFIGAISAQPSPAKAGQEVKITVSAEGEGSQYCGMVVHFDDGSESRQVKIDGGEVKFPVVIAKTYAKPGTYSIKAEGMKITSHFGCAGTAQASLVVEPAAVVAAATPASRCPTGYALKGKLGAAGDFTCQAGKGAAKPERVIDCGAKLEYFQTSSTLGCRKAGK